MGAIGAALGLLDGGGDPGLMGDLLDRLVDELLAVRGDQRRPAALDRAVAHELRERDRLAGARWHDNEGAASPLVDGVVGLPYREPLIRVQRERPGH